MLQNFSNLGPCVFVSCSECFSMFEWLTFCKLHHHRNHHYFDTVTILTFTQRDSMGFKELAAISFCSLAKKPLFLFLFVCLFVCSDLECSTGTTVCCHSMALSIIGKCVIGADIGAAAASVQNTMSNTIIIIIHTAIRKTV